MSNSAEANASRRLLEVPRVLYYPLQRRVTHERWGREQSLPFRDAS
jgi:hypothetical protein